MLLVLIESQLTQPNYIEMISSNLSTKEQIVVLCHGAGRNSTFHANENILSTHVEKEDFFASLVAPRLPVIGLSDKCLWGGSVRTSPFVLVDLQI